LVFGCGGNRDVSKRAEMGVVAARYADKVWVTSDNPRDEEPEKIIDDILKGIAAELAEEVAKKASDLMPLPDDIHRCVERGNAIADALQAMQTNDVLIIAGKGHEDYMKIKGKRTAWHDATWVRQCLDAAQVSV